MSKVFEHQPEVTLVNPNLVTFLLFHSTNSGQTVLLDPNG